ncbi:MAG: ABC transporter permease, partial [Candidatus Eremiobacteraeota bacterium]|nr:ABC transporter permease [Candidatus Eremiobacteraeota bacterium]
MLATLRVNLKQDASHRYIELLRVLTERYVKVRYRGSFLGVYWSLLNPVVMTAVYTLIFGHAWIKHYNNSIIDYVLSAFVGLVVINFFSTSTAHALPAVVSNSALLNKIKLPPSVFPLSLIAASCYQLAVGAFPFLVIMALVTSKSAINVLLLPIPLVALILVSSGFALFASMLYVFFRDIPYMYELLTFIFWVTTPVFYPADIIPQQYRIYLELNPLTPIIESIRQLTLSAGLPSFGLLGESMLMGVVVGGLG